MPQFIECSGSILTEEQMEIMDRLQGDGHSCKDCKVGCCEHRMWALEGGIDLRTCICVAWTKE